MIASRFGRPLTPPRLTGSSKAINLQRAFQIQRCAFTNCTSLQKQDRPQRRPLSKASRYISTELEAASGLEDRLLARKNERDTARLWNDIRSAKEQITPASEGGNDAARLEADMLCVQARERHRIAKKAYIEYRVSLYRRQLITSTDPNVISKNLDRARDLSSAAWGCVRADWASLLRTLLSPLDKVGMSVGLVKVASVLWSTFGPFGFGVEIVLMRTLILFGTPAIWALKNDDQKRL